MKILVTFISLTLSMFSFGDPDCSGYEPAKYDWMNSDHRVCEQVRIDMEYENTKNELTNLVSEYSLSFNGKYKKRMDLLNKLINEYDVSWLIEEDKKCRLETFNSNSSPLSIMHESNCTNSRMVQVKTLFDDLLRECKDNPPTKDGDSEPCMNV